MRAAVIDARWQPIVNLAQDPAATTKSSGNYYADTGTHTNAVVPVTGVPSDTAWRMTFTSPSTPGRANAAVGAREIPVAPDRTLTGSIYGYATRAYPMNLNVRFLNGSGGTVGFPETPANINVDADTWQRLAWTGIVPHTAAFLRLSVTVPSNANQWQTGDFLQATAVMVTVGDELYAYADGDSTGWRWLGTPNSSASVGYPRPV